MKIIKTIIFSFVILLLIFVFLMIILMGVFISENQKEQKNDEEVRGNGEDKALILYQESRGNLVTDSLQVVADHLEKNGYQITKNHPRDDNTYIAGNYELVVFITPVYAGKIAEPICNYAEKQDFTGVKVVNIITGLNDGTEEISELESHIKNAKEMCSIKIGNTDEITKKELQNILEREDGMTGQVYQPFQMKISPIQKLMLYNFEKNPDEIYKGLELQYWGISESEKGYLVIAYRNDDYVDVYVEEALKDYDFGQFEVCGNGLKNLVIEPLGNPIFEKSENGIISSFQFRDISGRSIQVNVKENSKKQSKEMDIVAPVGDSSKDPVMLPVFAMYDFDFVRKSNSIVDIEIDGKKMVPDSFPVPMPKDGQMRYFTRYGYDCELVEFAPSGEQVLTLSDYEKEPVCQDGLVAKYKTKDDQIRLESLSFENSRHTCKLKFLDLFPDILRMDEGMTNGAFMIEMDDSIGNISGKYTVSKQQEFVTIDLEPSDGWNVNNKTIFSKILFQKNSLFRKWPESYRYIQKININSGASESEWERM